MNKLMIWASIIGFLVIAENGIGQQKLSGMTIEAERYKATDTIPIVNIVNENKDNSDVQYFLNDVRIDEQAIGTIPGHQIASINVEKDSVVTVSKSTQGRIYISTNSDYSPKLISLKNLQKKYLDLKEDQKTIFMIDGKIVHGDYNSIKVDEKFILSIESQVVNKVAQISIIQLTTRTESNLEKANQIHIRGNNVND